MNVLVIQNSDGAPAAYLGDYLVDRYGATLNVVRPETLNGAETPPTFDLLLALGSRYGIHDDPPWIERERNFLRRSIDAGIPTIGICFGAQLIAAAIGGDSAPAGRRYAGWYENDRVHDDVWRGPWLRWHGDAIAVPAGAVTLATSDGTVQAFQAGRALGVQFHPEAGPATLDHWIASASDDLRSQLDVPALRERSATLFDAMAARRAAVFDAMLSRVAGRLENRTGS